MRCQITYLRIQFGVLSIVLSSSFLFGQNEEINYDKILENSREILQTEGSVQAREDCIKLLEKKELNWRFRARTILTLEYLSKNCMMSTNESKSIWQSLDIYSQNENCYDLNTHTYTFYFRSLYTGFPYQLYLFREIDYFKSHCDSLKMGYDFNFQVSLRALGETPNLKKFQQRIDQYHKKNKRLPTIIDIGREQAHNLYSIFIRSDKTYISKYIDEIRDIEKKKLFDSSYLAKIEDRLLYLNNKPSLYGTIVVNEGEPLHPIEDIQNLDHRRIKKGLFTKGTTFDVHLDLLKYYKIK